MASPRGEVLKQAAVVMRRRPAQSALTVLGLTIGVGAFIAMLSFGEGARRSVLSQFQVLGANLLKVNPVGVQQARGGVGRPLTDDDVTAIRREGTTTASAAPVSRGGATVSYRGAHRYTTLYGTLPSFGPLHRWHASSGGLYDDSDVAQRAKVCVLGATPAEELFGESDPLGQVVTLREKLPCRVIGVLSPKGHSTSGDDLDNLVLLPGTTYTTYLGDGKHIYSYLEIAPASPKLLEAAKAEVSTILRRSHALSKADLDDFTVSSPLEVVRAADRTSKIITRLLQGVAALSLLVGGIGVMNIQLVAVAERIEEIGIKSAIGASPGQILVQFLAEAAVLSVCGAACGVALGVGVATAVAGWMAWPRVISLAGVVGSALFGIAIGMLFGLLPARRASRLDPVEALRHE